jgi:hypothetical protein
MDLSKEVCRRCKWPVLEAYHCMGCDEHTEPAIHLLCTKCGYVDLLPADGGKEKKSCGSAPKDCCATR